LSASAKVELRPATEQDVELIYGLIVALAEYEREPDAVIGTPEMLRRWLFGETPAAETVIAEVDGEAAGFALFHSTFSTWECQPGIWLEDLFVLPEYRRHGVGGKLLAHIANVTVERGYTRMAWAALKWNELALGFYRKIGAEELEAWQMLRLSGPTLAAVASQPDA
jgi:GNAT superfamily N-acetyltransferase